MYPYIEVGGIKIYFVGIGIIISVFVYLILIYKFSKKYQLNFRKYFSYFWLVILLTYLLGTYFRYVFEYKDLFPSSFNEILYLLSPFGFKFNFIGLSTGFLLSHLFFLNKVKFIPEKLKWIDIIFYSTMITIFILGFFLLLGDNFIGRPTDSIIGVSSLMNCPDMTCTRLLFYSKVYPVGLFLSIVALVSGLIILILHLFFRKFYGLGIIGFIIFLLLLNFVFIFENYPRYLVLLISEKYSIRLDIKNWWSLILIMILIFYTMNFFNNGKNRNNRIS